MTISTSAGPRPLFIVHHTEPGRLLASCGAFPGTRRTAGGTFVQDTAHYTLTPHSGFDGGEVCPDCLAAIGTVSASDEDEQQGQAQRPHQVN